MQSLNTLAFVKGTFFRVSVIFDLSPKKNKKKKNKNNKVRCKLTLRVSKNHLTKIYCDIPCMYSPGVAYDVYPWVRLYIYTTISCIHSYAVYIYLWARLYNHSLYTFTWGCICCVYISWG